MKKKVQSLLFITLLTSVFTAFAAPIKNGFDLSNSTIPVDKIFQGGPPRDGIPSIDDPKFLTVEDADYLKDEDRILGIYYQGDARAYPIRLLNWHEIVNDKIAGNSVAVTYCPLCGSGIVYKADINGKPSEFGVSGLLYNSDVLLYDRQTETLWSQILSKAVSGQLVNEKLAIIPSAHTSWKAWKAKHPTTKVLSTDTGFSRDYSKSPYGSYDENRATFFPVEFKSKRYHPKERVLGINLQGKQKVYPFAELAKLEGTVLKDRFENQELRVSFDLKNRDGVIKNEKGEILESINTFWFAWYGFYPKADIYTAPK